MLLLRIVFLALFLLSYSATTVTALRGGSRSLEAGSSPSTSSDDENDEGCFCACVTESHGQKGFLVNPTEGKIYEQVGYTFCAHPNTAHEWVADGKAECVQSCLLDENIQQQMQQHEEDSDE